MSARAGETSLTRAPTVFKRCEGSGEKLNSTMAVIFGAGLCPECSAMVETDHDGIIEEHEIWVIG